MIESIEFVSYLVVQKVVLTLFLNVIDVTFSVVTIKCTIDARENIRIVLYNHWLSVGAPNYFVVFANIKDFFFEILGYVPNDDTVTGNILVEDDGNMV